MMGNKKNKKDIENMHPKRENLTTHEKNKVLILCFISIILAVVAEYIISSSGNNIALSRAIIIWGICTFIGLHFVIGFKKLYTIIIENRFKISSIMIVFSTILGFFQNEVEIKEWLLNTESVLSLWWNIKFYGLLLVSYELFNIITDGNKGYSVIGTIVIAFSGAVQWNFNKIDSLILGQLIVVLLDKLLKEEKIIKKVIFSIGIFASIISYFFTFEGYAISFGYVFIALIVWIFIKNKEYFKNKKTLVISISTLLISIVCAIVTKYIAQIHYNDAIIDEGRGIQYLFTYLYNIVLPFKDLSANNLYGSFISIFPLPMLFALYYMYKNDDHLEFLLPITIVTIVETVFCMSGFPEVLNKISLFSNVSLSSCIVAVNLANVYILFYTIKHIDKKIFSITAAMRIAVVLMIVVGFLSYPVKIATRGYLNLFIIEACLLSFLYPIFQDKNYKNVLLFFLCVLTLISGLTVNPIVLI